MDGIPMGMARQSDFPDKGQFSYDELLTYNEDSHEDDDYYDEYSDDYGIFRADEI